MGLRMKMNRLSDSRGFQDIYPIHLLKPIVYLNVPAPWNVIFFLP